MRLVVRLLGGISLAVVLVTAGFAYLEVREERIRLEQDLQRRAVLAADAAREASERLVARGARTGYDRVLARFSRPDRAIAIYDAFGSVIDATPDVRRGLGPISPLIGEAIQKNAPARGFAPVAGRIRLVYVLPLQDTDRPIGAAAVLVDAEPLETSEWDLWRRTGVRFGVLM